MASSCFTGSSYRRHCRFCLDCAEFFLCVPLGVSVFVWIIVLVSHSYTEVNYYNPDLPETKEFLKVHRTVPAGIADGQEIKESLPVWSV